MSGYRRAPVRYDVGVLLTTCCPVCARPGPVPCSVCAAALRPAPAAAVPALLAFDGAGRVLVSALKYRNARPVAAALAPGLAALAPAADVVTWAPTSPARRRERGFDQAELLARAVARRLGVPCRGLLLRRPGPAQTGRTRADRLARPPCFVPTGRPAGRVVLLVDDVVTTGATLHAAAAALVAAGATAVHPLAAAATPDHRPDGTYGR